MRDSLLSMYTCKTMEGMDTFKILGATFEPRGEHIGGSGFPKDLNCSARLPTNGIDEEKHSRSRFVRSSLQSVDNARGHAIRSRP